MKSQLRSLVSTVRRKVPSFLKTKKTHTQLTFLSVVGDEPYE